MTDLIKRELRNSFETQLQIKVQVFGPVGNPVSQILRRNTATWLEFGEWPIQPAIYIDDFNRLGEDFVMGTPYSSHELLSI
jgi:hypothetical protein